MASQACFPSGVRVAPRWPSATNDWLLRVAASIATSAIIGSSMIAAICRALSVENNANQAL